MIQVMTRELFQPTYPRQPGGRSWRRETCTLFLAEVLYQACLSEPLYQYGISTHIIDEIGDSIHECKAYVVPDPTLPMIEAPARMIWNEEQAEAWNQVFSKLKKSVHIDLLRNSENSIGDILGAILMVLQEVRDFVSEDRRGAWEILVQCVEKVYQYIELNTAGESLPRIRNIGLKLRDIVFERDDLSLSEGKY